MSAGVRFAVFLAVVLTVWALQHVYVGWRLLSLPAFACGWPRRLLWAGLVAGFVSYPLGRILWHAGWLTVGRAAEMVGAVWMGALFLLMAAFLVADLLTLGGLVLRPWVPAIRGTAAVLALLAAAVALWGGLRTPRTVEVEVMVPGLSAEADGLTVVQLSDVHLGTLRGQALVDTVLRRVGELDPDVVAITGDLIDGDAGVVERLLPSLEQLRAPLGVYAVLGNHEYYAGRERARKLLADAGYTVLDNASVEVAPGVFVAGVPDPRGSAQTGEPEADLPAALAGLDPAAAVVLLLHSPEMETEAAAAGVDVMLNGHTHGGQIWPFHLLVKRAYPSLAGVYGHGSMTQVVSRGAGTWGPPMRLLAPSDVVRVTLRSPLG